MTRARSKSIVCIPAPLLEATPQVLDVEEAERGLAYMRQLAAAVAGTGEQLIFDLEPGARVRVLRTSVCYEGPYAGYSGRLSG